MKAKAIALFAALLLSVIQSIVFLGCNNERGNSVSANSENSKKIERMPGEPNQWPDSENNWITAVQPADSGSYFMTLNNGTKIYFVSKTIKGDSLNFRFRYKNSNGFSGERILKLSSLSGVSICRADGSDLFHYDFEMIDTNKVKYSAATSTDSLQVLHEITEEKVSAVFSINGTSHSIEFNDKDEAGRAKELYAEYKESNLLSGFNDSDQQLIEKMRQLEEFLNIPASLLNNPDAEVAMNLMNDPEYLRWVIDNDQQVLAPCDRKCICAIAEIISTISCAIIPLFPPAVILCVPAAGIGLACAIADFVEWLISLNYIPIKQNIQTMNT